mmetsp:Transcript_7647/g.18659  ORF Transcript_7647/g.18659 Transcript_7647/m.18659 type:complete len:190 (+) Transcript_7647:154-723(+)|eukprot:CAMPEP_0114506934 /NCGR_PEP_ID=MMETSP0109-20121206/11720_1 /TAXON_ID=29199 /ORGANISM="Chlorarachnion reptans, Strain CCCM449" /LENGTH=189 /DNA_ID=CAMNT_0001685611 /DNA_START=83 /DNA_END=652 /DNA_ORIENTATION=-
MPGAAFVGSLEEFDQMEKSRQRESMMVKLVVSATVLVLLVGGTVFGCWATGSYPFAPAPKPIVEHPSEVVPAAQTSVLQRGAIATGLAAATATLLKISTKCETNPLAPVLEVVSGCSAAGVDPALALMDSPKRGLFRGLVSRENLAKVCSVAGFTALAGVMAQRTGYLDKINEERLRLIDRFCEQYGRN